MGLGEWVDEKWQNAHDAGAKVFGYESYAEADRKEQAQKAEQAYSQNMSQLEQSNSGLKEGVEGFDSPSVMQCVNWEGFSHAQIFQTNQDSIEPGKVGPIADAWKELGAKLRQNGETFAEDMKGILSGNWEGEAGEKANESYKPASDWMIGSGNAFEMTGNNMAATGDGAEKAKNMVGEPEGFNGWQSGLKVAASPVMGGIDEVGKMEQRQEEEKAARQTMANVYSPTVSQVDQQMPKYRKPDGTAVEPPPAQPQQSTNWGGGGGATTPATAGPGGPGGMSTVPGGSHPGTPGTYGPGTGGPGGPGTNVPGGPGSTTPSTSAPASAMTPGGPGAPGGAATTGGPGGGGMAGGVAGGMAGAPGGAPGGKAGTGPGGRAGTGGGARAGAPGAAGTAAGRGGGRGAMGGMGGRGGQGQGEDDEHERPSWLEENDDVWFNDMPKTAPPVLGE